MLKRHFTVAYDQAGSIGRRYRRQDEVGTPFGITIDHQTMEDDTVTLRDRDSTEQERFKIAALPARADRTHRLASLGRLRLGTLAGSIRVRRNSVLTIRRASGDGRIISTMARVHPEIYFFGAGVAEGRADDARSAGRQGREPAPRWPRSSCRCRPASPLSTRVCNYFYDHGSKYPTGLKPRAWPRASRESKRRWAASSATRKNPLLVSVRSGARVSMPGMMDTVLNLGLTDETVKGLEAASGNARFAWDSYRRFCQMYGDVVLKLKPENKNDPDPFEELIDRKEGARGVNAGRRSHGRRSEGTGRRVPRI